MCVSYVFVSSDPRAKRRHKTHTHTERERGREREREGERERERVRTAHNAISCCDNHKRSQAPHLRSSCSQRSSAYRQKSLTPQIPTQPRRQRERESEREREVLPGAPKGESDGFQTKTSRAPTQRKPGRNKNIAATVSRTLNVLKPWFYYFAVPIWTVYERFLVGPFDHQDF